MKFTIVLAFIAALVLAVSAVPSRETNAQRLARGLGPMKPRNLGSPVGCSWHSFARLAAFFGYLYLRYSC